MIHIYGLIDPRTHEVCYVGQSAHYLTRYRQHLADASDGAKAHWIAELRQCALEPWLVILDIAQDKVSANQKEEWWIVFARHMQWRSVNSTYPSGGWLGIPDHLSKQLDLAKQEANRAVNRAWLVVYGFLCLFISFTVIHLAILAVTHGATPVGDMGFPLLSRWMFVLVWTMQYVVVYTHHIVRTTEPEKSGGPIEFVYWLLAACHVIQGIASLIEIGKMSQ